MPVILGRGVVSAGRIGSGRRGPVVSGSRECRSYWVGEDQSCRGVVSAGRIGSERTSRVGES